MPNWENINECHKMIDFLLAWVNYSRQPNAWSAPADTLEDRAAAFALKVKENSK